MTLKTKETAFRPDRGGVRPVLLVGILVLAAGLVAGFLLLRKDDEAARGESSSFTTSRRPAAGKLLFDYAGLLRLQDEAVEGYLKGIRDNRKIEPLIVTLPTLRGFRSIQEAAAKIMAGWKIGEKYGNKGILLLLASAEKEVKMEVSYELEDVFTDLYTGIVEDQQLKPHLLAGDLGTGLVAVMEVMEERAEIKRLGNYTPKMIADLDAQFASGGAGARKQLDQYAEDKPGLAASSILSQGSSIFTDSGLLALGKTKEPRFPAGKTPEEAYEIMKAAFSQDPASKETEYFRRTQEFPHEVIQTKNRAVVFFGNEQGWDHAPFLFAKLPDGWKFDIVNQKHVVRFGNAPYWGVEHGEYDYMDLLSQCPSWQSVDVPWGEEDIYRVERDSQLVAEILRLEEAHRNNPDDFDTVLELGRLGIITSRRPNQVIPYLQKAKSLKPDDTAPYKYIAAAYVTMTYQYKKAIAEIEDMLRLNPRDVFGLKFLGYLYSQSGDSLAAEKYLKAALEIAPSDCYAMTTLGRVYAKKAKAGGSPQDKEAAAELLRKSESACADNPKRARWLRNALIPAAVPRVWFGSTFYSYNYEGQGVLAFDIQPGSPAERAGLQEGDFVLSFDGTPIFRYEEVINLISARQPGETIKIEIVRGALEGPLDLGDASVTPLTARLNPPQRLTLEVILGRKDNPR